MPHDPTDALQVERRPPLVRGYVPGELLGEGGFALVWSAVRERDGAALALKVARAASSRTAERFRREAEAMAAIGPPHTPALHDRGALPDGRPYLAMERLHGQTLAARIARAPAPLSPSEIARVGAAALASLAAAHARGVVHRDLKPDNLFLADGAARVALLDFGLTRRVGQEPGDDLTRTGLAAGTPAYMAPEQLRAERQLDARADVYAFGVILYQLLTARLPFEGEDAAVAHGHLALRPPRPSHVAPVPAALEALVLACLAKQPGQRPADAGVLQRELAAACAAALSVPAPAAPAPRPAILADGPQPAVILLLEHDGEAAAILDAIAARGGFPARQRGARHIAVFSGLDVEDPARAALSAARAVLGSRGGRAALHLAGVTIRRRPGEPPAAYGAALDRPESWLPKGAWSGVVVTPALSETLPETDHAAARPPKDPAAEPLTDPAAEPPAEIPFLGRAPLVEAIAASLSGALDGGSPTLVTALGGHGLGKSRLAAEVAALVCRAHPGAEVVLLQGQGAAAATAPELARRGAERGVAVILDDAHWADRALLDGLEAATLDGSGCRLWVLVTAHPRLLSARPAWGARTRHHLRLSLDPLDDGPALELAAALLRPAEYPPAAVLERLVRWSGGSPFALTEIARALRRAGVIRRRPGARSFYVSTADVDALPASPVFQWLAARRLAALPPGLSACARLCAALGTSFHREEVAWVADALERAGGAGTPVDAGFGLTALVDEGLLTETDGGRFSFRDAPLQDAIEDLVAPAQRAAIHEHALAYWRTREGRDAGALEPIARHAAACGRRDEAASALLRLGDAALAAHAHAEADLRYTAALAMFEGGEGAAPRRRAEALAGRGRCRYRIGRAREAWDDLREARALAEALGDRALLAELILEEATALDWLREFELSAQRAGEAAPLVAALAHPRLSARLLLARGRTAGRRGELPEAIAFLEQARAAAAAQGDHEPLVIALLILGALLTFTGRPDAAEARFDEAIARATAEGDRVHLVMAHYNRTNLWIVRHDLERGLADARSAVTLARELGDPLTERMVTVNTAELLHQLGRYDDALELARRVCLLEERFLDRPAALGPLLTARIQLERGDIDEARRLVSWIREASPPDLTEHSEVHARNTLHLTRLTLVLEQLGANAAGAASDGAAWGELVRAAEAQVDPIDVLEILAWRARMAALAGDPPAALRALEKAEPWLAQRPPWRPRFDELRRRLGGGAELLSASSES
ncbi:protein kinase [Sorangium sp. So ce327]|uniref:serine/threonine-protein kinase n=1 Tax=Sorangium sp. So ce327 TaxID=3133301 RepID=UPI003F6462FA